jgi:hypothetical protein
MKSLRSPSSNGKRRARIVGPEENVRCRGRTDPKPNIRKRENFGFRGRCERWARDEASCYSCAVVVSQHPACSSHGTTICDSAAADIRFSLGSTGAGGSSVFIRMHFKPGRPQRAYACGLFGSGFLCAPATCSQLRSERLAGPQFRLSTWPRAAAMSAVGAEWTSFGQAPMSESDPKRTYTYPVKSTCCWPTFLQFQSCYIIV